MGHGTSAILDNLKESLFNVTEKLKEFGNETDFEKVLKVNNEVSDVLASLKELDEALSSFTSEQVTAKLEEATSLINTVQTKLDNDDFKGDKGNPFIYSDFTPEQIETLKVKGDKGDGGDFLAQDYNNLINKPIDTTRQNLEFFRFANNDTSLPSFGHLKTNISFTNKMFSLIFSGYSYSRSETVFSFLSGYTHSSGQYLNSSHSHNLFHPLLVSNYRSSDGFLVIVFNNSWLLSFLISLTSYGSAYSTIANSHEVTEVLFNNDALQKMF